MSRNRATAGLRKGACRRPVLAWLFVGLALIAVSGPGIPIATAVEVLLARDPGVRAGKSAGDPIARLTPAQRQVFESGKVEFADTEVVGDGLGPRMSLDNCSGCHAQPAVGGSSPPVNPQVGFAIQNRGGNVLPSFIAVDGPVRVARFITKDDGSPSGEVQGLFTIAGRADAPNCKLAQPDFAAALAKRNVALRIPSPMFGAGLIEQIPDSAIFENKAANEARNKTLGISGHVNVGIAGEMVAGKSNTNGNRSELGRFGWKAQHKSVLLFAAEAYNLEMGISNELFPEERDQIAGCYFEVASKTPPGRDGEPAIDTLRRYRTTEGHRYMTVDDKSTVDNPISIDRFAAFIRLLAPPVPSQEQPGGASSIVQGKAKFTSVGCAACHTPTLHTGDSTDAVMRHQPLNLYSDLLVHDMGPELADGITQGRAGPRDFRTAPLWGLGQRIFFLHDGRTKDLLAAIRFHRSGAAANGDASEANMVVDNFDRLNEAEKQNVLDFLRSL